MGSGNSLYNSTSVSWQVSKKSENNQQRGTFNRRSQRLHFLSVVMKLILSYRHCIKEGISTVLTTSFTHLFEGVACNCLECLFYVYGFFGAGLKVRDVVLTLTPTLSPFSGYLCVKGEKRLHQYKCTVLNVPCKDGLQVWLKRKKIFIFFNV